jgi:hypothetical protein
MKCSLDPIPGDSRRIFDYISPINFAGNNKGKDKADIWVNLLDDCKGVKNHASTRVKIITYNWVYKHKLTTEALAKETQTG